MEQDHRGAGIAFGGNEPAVEGDPVIGREAHRLVGQAQLGGAARHSVELVVRMEDRRHHSPRADDPEVAEIARRHGPEQGTENGEESAAVRPGGSAFVSRTGERGSDPARQLGDLHRHDPRLASDAARVRRTSRYWICIVFSSTPLAAPKIVVSAVP